MQHLTLAMFAVVTLFGFFAEGDHWGRWAVLPRSVKYLPELFGVAAIIVVILLGTRNRFQFVRPQYWLVFGALVITIICGILVNNVDSGPIFAGIRMYLRAIPWFLVPAVYAFSNAQLVAQLRALLAVAIMQVPFSIQQRMTSVGQDKGTGDFTIGTLSGSSTLSIFLVCGICILAALFVRKRLQGSQFIVLSILLLLPTTINETKGTLILLPIGLLVAFFAAAERGRWLRVVVPAAVTLIAFGLVFVPIYDYLSKEREYGSHEIGEFYSDPALLERYLWKKQDAGTTREVGRVDAIVIPISYLTADPVRAVFGYGIGNVSDSALGRGFVGKYNGMFEAFLITSFARLTLELGLLGMCLVSVLMWLIWQDCRMVARQSEGYLGALAAAWAGVTVVMAVSFLYKDIIGEEPLSYLFWYFSGIVAAARMRVGPDLKIT